MHSGKRDWRSEYETALGNLREMARDKYARYYEQEVKEHSIVVPSGTFLSFLTFQARFPLLRSLQRHFLCADDALTDFLLCSQPSGVSVLRI